MLKCPRLNQAAGCGKARQVRVMLFFAMAATGLACNTKPDVTAVRGRVPAEWFTGTWVSKECPSCDPLYIDMASGKIISITKREDRILETVQVDRGYALLTAARGDGNQEQSQNDIVVLIRADTDTLVLRESCGSDVFVRSQKDRHNR